MKIGIAVLAVVLGGCAAAPKDVVEQGERFTGQIALQPAEAARCIARHVEFDLGAYSAKISTLDAQTTEMILSAPGSGYLLAMSVWRFTPSGTGSAYEVWITPHLMRDRPAHIAWLRGKC